MDKILRTLICEGQVSLTVLQTDGIVNRAVKIHKLSNGAAHILGGLLTCGAYLGSVLKEESGSVSLTVKAKNGDGAVSVSCDSALHVRGYADGTCGRTLAGGTLTVVREDGYFQPFVGTCEIESDDISDILAAYFGQSEQIASAVCIETDIGESGDCISAGGIVMQLLPDASEEAIGTATELYERFCSRDKSTPIDAQKVFDDVFAPYVSGGVNTLFPEYKCNCSRQKINRVVASLGKAEFLNIIEEQGEVRVHCHYCNKDYVYTRKNAEEIFGK